MHSLTHSQLPSGRPNQRNPSSLGFTPVCTQHAAEAAEANPHLLSCQNADHLMRACMLTAAKRSIACTQQRLKVGKIYGPSHELCVRHEVIVCETSDLCCYDELGHTGTFCSVIYHAFIKILITVSYC